jgi:hypothetical protein
LSVNPNKTVVIPFTRKRNIKRLKEITLFSKTIQLSSEVKYVGITLDKGLTCQKQLDMVSTKPISLLNMQGHIWVNLGTETKVIYWIYTAVVRPIVTYATTIWWLRVKLKTSQAELSKLQRMACLEIKGAMRTAPPAAMEVLLGLPPSAPAGESGEQGRKLQTTLQRSRETQI